MIKDAKFRNGSPYNNKNETMTLPQQHQIKGWQDCKFGVIHENMDMIL